MTLQASGVISINDIATELGIANTGLNLNDSRCRSLAGIASGGISLSNFYGKANASVQYATWNGKTADYSGGRTSRTYTAQIQWLSNGTISTSGSTSPDAVTDTLNGALWYSPATSGIGANYWINITGPRSTTSNSPTSTWISLNSSPIFTWSQTNGSSVGINYGLQSYQAQIATDPSGSTIVYTGNFNMGY